MSKPIVVAQEQTIEVSAVGTVPGFTISKGSRVHVVDGETIYGQIVGVDEQRCCNYVRGTTYKYIFAQDQTSLAAQNAALRTDLETALKEKAAALQSEAKLKAELDTAKATISNKTTELQRRIEADTAEMERLKQQHQKNLQDTNAKHQADLLEAQKLGDVQVNALKAEQAAELTALNESYQANLSSKAEELAKTQTALLTAQKNMSELDTKTKKLASDLEQAKIALNALVAEKEKIVETDSAQFKLLGERITQQTEKITILEKEAADFEAVKASLMDAKQDIRNAEIAMEAGKDKSVITKEIREETTVVERDERGSN